MWEMLRVSVKFKPTVQSASAAFFGAATGDAGGTITIATAETRREVE